MPTPKQNKLIRLIFENIGKKEETKTLGEMLKEAGYSPAIQKNPYLIFESETIQEGIADVVDEMKKERERAIKAMRAKNLDDVAYDRLTDVIDKLTKNIQLLGGKPTEIVNDYSQLTDEELIRKAKGGSGISEKGISEEAS